MDDSKYAEEPRHGARPRPLT